MQFLAPIEVELFMAVAKEPFIVPRQLISPEINMAAQWFITPFAVRIFSAIARDALSDKPANLISIMQQSGVTSEERVYITKLWREGKESGSADIEPLIAAMQNEYMQREVNNIWKDYTGKVVAHPDLIRDHVHDMGAQLSTVAYDGVTYNPDPTTHYGDFDVVIGSSWRSNALDGLYGGVPNMGYGLFIAPSGYGKSSFARSLVAYAVIRSVFGERTDALLATNEMKAGITSRGIRDSLRDMWQTERSHDDIDGDIRHHVKLYEDTYSFARFEQMIHWHRPNIAIIDSLDALGFPASAEKLKDEKEKHQARAIALNDMSAKFGCFIIVPANASGENQMALKQGRLDKVYQAFAFGSQWYENKATYATVMTWDVDSPGISLFKNTKNRPQGQSGVGHIWSMKHSYEGHYYRDSVQIDLNA